ncbi:hypothetical protein FJZ53_06385 [Candidatus Woesearchaeota archaeon]|nr:hypothetical protein [Candidatus Woesearchaeota archaeon]
MKLPKTFIPKNNLEEKTNQLLEKPKSKSLKVTAQFYEELKAEFPNFTDYLFSLYPDLKQDKITDKKEKTTKKLYITNQKATSAFLVCKIEPYVEKHENDVSEYGYNIRIKVENVWHLLKYREGYYIFDKPSLSTKNPLRCDKHKDIPFP